MPSKQKYRLGDLQLRIMQVLWQSGVSGVASVARQVGGDLAYTTIATMLRRMEERGLVRHHEDDRKFLYEAVVTSDAVTSSMTGDLVDRLFAGSLSAAVSHLLESHEVSTEELSELEELIREQRRKQ